MASGAAFDRLEDVSSIQGGCDYSGRPIREAGPCKAGVAANSVIDAGLEKGRSKEGKRVVA